MSVDAFPFLSPVGIATYTSDWFANRAGHQHQGLDFPIPQGTFVYAVAPGIVRYTSDADADGTGRWIVIEHTGDFAGFSSRYLHLSKRLARKRNATVAAGELIALSGNTGRSTGPHLHFDMQATNTLLPELRPTIGALVGRRAGIGRHVPGERLLPVTDRKNAPLSGLDYWDEENLEYGPPPGLGFTTARKITIAASVVVCGIGVGGMIYDNRRRKL